MLTGQLWMRGGLDGGAPVGIFRQQPPGSSATLVSTFPRRTNGLAVSTDGTLLAIGYDGVNDELVVVPASGGAEVSLYTSAGTQVLAPVLSPDKTQVAFSEGNPNTLGFDLKVISTSGTGTARLASPTRVVSNLLNVNDYAFSFDSRYLALTGDFTVNQTFELHVFDTAMGTIVPLVTSTSATAGDGAREFGWTNTGQVLVRAALGGGATRLHLCTVAGVCTPLPGTTTTFTVGSLAVSADGTFAVFASNERGTGAYDLYRVSTAGGTPTRLAPDAPSGWRPVVDSVFVSPNGQWVTAQANAGSGQGVYVFATGGGSALAPLYVATGAVAVFNLTFSPNSNGLAFRADINLDGSYDLFRFTDLVTPAQTPVLLQSTQGGSVTELRWTP